MSLTLQPIALGEELVGPRLSVGVACYPDDGDDAETLLRRADHAMYEAKHAGGNVARFCDAGSQRQASPS